MTRIHGATVLLSLFLLSCSQNNDGESSGGGGPGTLKRGEFHDAAVQGLSYEGSGVAGLTGETGEFEYRDDSLIRFTLGDIELGGAIAAPLLTPLDLAGADSLDTAPPAALNIARLLLTLDRDCRVSNGIQIHPAARLAGQGRTLDFTQPHADFAADPRVSGYLSAVHAAGGMGCQALTPLDEARDHLDDTLDHIEQHGVPNRRPTASASAPAVVTAGDDVQLLGSGTDTDGSVRFDWSQIEGPTAVLEDPTAAETRFTAPNVSEVRRIVFELIVTDDDGATDSARVSIRVEPADAPPNRPPVAEDQAFTTAEDTPLQAQLDASDPDGDPLSFEVVEPPAHGTLALDEDGAFNYTPAPNFFGEDTFRFRVSDGRASSGVATVTLTITPVNDPPVADAGPAQSVQSGDPVTLNGSGEDVEGEVSFAWTQLEGPTVTLQGADQAQATFDAPEVDIETALVFELTVTDDEGASDSDTTTVTVSPADAENLPPTADAGADQTVPEQSEVTLDGTASADPDGEIASYQWTQDEDGAPRVELEDADTPVARFFSSAVTEPTELGFTLTVTDDDGATASDGVSITVEPVNAAPAADAGPDQTVDEGSEVQLDGSGSQDSDGQITAFAWEQVEGPDVELDDPASPMPSFTAPQVDSGTETLGFELTVTDNEGASASDRVDIFVRDTSQPGAGSADLLAQEAEAQLRGCDPLDPAHCLYPFPSDHFTVAAAPGTIQHADRGGTGKRINFNPLAMPRNSVGKPIDPSEWNRNDGFSPGQLIVTYVPLLNLPATYELPAENLGISNPELSLRDDAPIQVLEIAADGGATPHLVIAETDVNASLLLRDDSHTAYENPASQGRSALLIRPMKNFREGRRYVVVLRDLRDAGGNPITAPPAFEVCRERQRTGLPSLDKRCDALEAKVFPALLSAGIARDDSLYLAWDFTVGSTNNQIARLRHMRDTAGLGDNCDDPDGCTMPSYSIDRVLLAGDDGVESGIAKQIHGTLTVPSFVVPVDPSPAEDAAVQQIKAQMQASFPSEFADLFAAADPAQGVAAPPNRLFYNPFDAIVDDPANPDSARYGDGLPDSVGTMDVPFICQIPSQAAPDNPARAGIYGHGLLDQRRAITYDGVDDLSREYNYLFCAVDLFGFATGDIANVASTLVDLSNFQVVPDASQQGLLNYLALARLLKAPQGFAADPVFQANGLPVFDNSEIFYDGNSQGGIVGGAVLAASKDITRGVLGSLGMNYSMLLRRSLDFDLYSIPLYLSYTDELDRNLLFSLIQMLWDRSENNGYAHHITDNSAFGGPDNVAKLDPQFGDHEVTMWSADVMARTMGIPWDGSQVERAAQELGQTKRHPDVEPGFGLEPLDYDDPGQTAGSALVLFDIDRGAGFAHIPPIENTPPASGPNPHDNDAKSEKGRCHKAHFLRTGGRNIQTIDVLFDGAACPAVPPAPPVTEAPPPMDGEPSLPDLLGSLPDVLALAFERLSEGDPEGALNATLAGGGEFANHSLALLAQAVGEQAGLVPPPADKPAPAPHTPAPLRAGTARGLLHVPIGTPLGGYLRPPIGGDYLPGLEAFAEGDPSEFFAELLDFLPTDQDHNGLPLAPVPDELRTVHAPYATYSPPSRGIYDSLVTKAIALHDGRDHLVLVKTDFIGMLDEVRVAVAEEVAARTGIALGDGLIMSATHTHDGPGAVANHSTRYFWLAMDAYQPALFEFLVPQLVDVVVAALEDLKPARIGHVIGEEGYAHPVRGTQHLNGFRGPGDRHRSVDVLRRLGVIRIDRLAPAPEPLAVIVNFAAHGIAFDVENLYFSGDVLGAVERGVEQSYDSPMLAMLVQSAGGDVSPRGIDNANKLQRIESYGRLMAPQVRALADGIENFQLAPDLRAVSQRVILSRERLGYAADEYPYPWGAAQCNNEVGTPFVGIFDTGERIPYCLPAPPPDPIDLLDNGVAENGAFVPQDSIVTAAKIGDILLLAQPGEPLTEYGRLLLERAAAEGADPADSFIWGYSQDHVGYILGPERGDWELGSTEGTTTFWGWKQGERFLDVSSALVRALVTDTAAPRDEFTVNYDFYRDLFRQQPAPAALPSFAPGTVLDPIDAEIARFGATRFAWEGGDPLLDNPRLTLERETATGWVVARRTNGEPIRDYFELHLEYRLASGIHSWSVDFEAPLDWPTGRYRIAVEGRALAVSGETYAVSSAPFEVLPYENLIVAAQAPQNEQLTVALAYPPQPDNYRVIDPLVPADRPAPVRRAQFTVHGSGGSRSFPLAPAQVIVSEGQLVARYALNVGGLGTIERIEAADAFGNLGSTDIGGNPPADDATADYGQGLIGLLARAGADAHPALTALLDSNPESAAAHTQTALDNLAQSTADGAGNFDPEQPGETGIGTAGELDEVALQLLATARNAAPVVITGNKLPGWSVPAAHGVGYPYPSGAAVSGALLDAFGGPGEVRNAHNGEILYPVAGSLGASGLVPVESIAAFRFDGENFIEIPVQVDERAPYFLANANSDFSTYSGTDPELTYVWDNGDDAHGWGEESWMMVAGTCERRYPEGLGPVPDPVQGLDDDDEIVFMASDAGQLYPGNDFPEDWQAVQAVQVIDPLRPDVQRVVYLAVRPGGSSFNAESGYIDYRRDPDAAQWIDRSFFAEDDPEKLGTSNTGYGANLHGTVCPDGTPDSAKDSNDRFPRDGVTVTTDTYRFQASGRWMLRDLRVRPADGEITEPAGWESRPDLLDRWKGRAFQQSPDSVISLVGFEDEQVNWEANSSLIGERCGPVRCIREVWGADSGTNVTKTETFYRDAISYQYRVRVHPIPPDGLYTSWDYNRSAMVPTAEERAAGMAGGRYFTMLRPQGVPIDGINDDLGNVDGYAPIPLAECVGDGGPQPPASSGHCAAFFDGADPTFNLPLAFNNWEQVSGKGGAGSLIYSFELVGLTSLANPLVVPYYRDDACLDDGTGDDPVPRPWPGESFDWNGGKVREAYDARAGRPLDYSGSTFEDCLERQGAHGSHGVHYFVTHDSDNAFTPTTSTEIDARQWQYIVPTDAPRNIGEPYANNIRVPLQALAIPMSPPPLGR